MGDEFDGDTPVSYPVAAAARTATNAIRAGIMLVTFLCFAITIGIYGWTGSQMASIQSGFAKVGSGAYEADGQVSSGMSEAQQGRIAEGLKSISASPQAARNIADRVTIVAVRFARLRNKRVDEAPDTLNQPYPVDFDLTRADRAAAVTLADQSVDWKVTPPKIAAARASFAIESSALPAYGRIPKGALAGFRIEGPRYTYAPIAMPIDPWDTTHQSASALCSSFDRWAKYFGIDRKGLSYILFEDPTRIWFDGRGWSSDGVTVARLDSEDVSTFCHEARSW